VLLDPPRTGAKEILPALARSAAARMVYVSCDPATLARDLKALAAGHWRVQEVTVIDLFPHTSHMETVCLLGR
jgi:23S rRNA (uracil1939-C5)-methyltransferase